MTRISASRETTEDFFIEVVQARPPIEPPDIYPVPRGRGKRITFPVKFLRLPNTYNKPSNNHLVQNNHRNTPSPVNSSTIDDAPPVYKSVGRGKRLSGTADNMSRDSINGSAGLQQNGRIETKKEMIARTRQEQELSRQLAETVKLEQSYPSLPRKQQSLEGFHDDIPGFPQYNSNNPPSYTPPSYNRPIRSFGNISSHSNVTMPRPLEKQGNLNDAFESSVPDGWAQMRQAGVSPFGPSSDSSSQSGIEIKTKTSKQQNKQNKKNKKSSASAGASDLNAFLSGNKQPTPIESPSILSMLQSATSKAGIEIPTETPKDLYTDNIVENQYQHANKDSNTINTNHLANTDFLMSLDEPEKFVLIKQIPTEVTEMVLMELMETFGKLISLTMQAESKSKTALVRMDEEVQCGWIVTCLNESHLNNENPDHPVLEVVHVNELID